MMIDLKEATFPVLNYRARSSSRPLFFFSTPSFQWLQLVPRLDTSFVYAHLFSAKSHHGEDFCW